MKNVLFVFVLFLNGIIAFGQTNATDFTATDCAGTSHNLFTELNSGKIIVLCWVMPCSSCISPSRTAYDAVQSFASSNPGKVVFYLVDDAADTPCNTLSSWGTTNGMPLSVKFSTGAVNPTDYGNVGMPKIVILGGSDHKVYYNEDDGANQSEIMPALNLAISSSGIDDNNSIVSDFTVVPNLVKNKTYVNFTLIQPGSVSIEILDITGKIVKTSTYLNQMPGKHEIQLDCTTFSNGLYFLNLKSGNTSKITKYILSH